MSKIVIEPGTRFGHLIYLNDYINPINGARMFMVKCDCGRVYPTTAATFKRENPKCYICANKEKAQKNVRHDLVGKTIGIWKVLSLKENIDGCNYYECECQKCHNKSLKKSCEITYSKENGKCKNCKPDYQFKVVGDLAIGTLPSGHQFIIDAEDIEKVSKFYWYKKSDQDYIVANVKGHPKYRLHRFVMGLGPIDESENDYIVDHINRNPLDCRKSNLRIATQHQNCFNKRIRSNNNTGYIGVSKEKKSYSAAIYFDGKEYIVGRSDNPAKCGAMYNYASQLIFDKFIGQRNAVEELDEKEKARIKEILTPILESSSRVTRTVAF